MKCVMCEEEIVGFGNNAQPVQDGRCCDICNGYVLHVRIKEIFSERYDKDFKKEKSK